MFGKKQKFEEDVVEETTTVVEETVPDSHEQFINLLVEMGLEAEQAEAVHQMAMDLVDAGGAEVVTESTTTEVAASRQNRALARNRRRRRGEYQSDRRRGRRAMSEERAPKRERGSREERFSGRRRFSEDRMKRRLFEKMRELRKENEELKAQLGQNPAATKLSVNPTRGVQKSIKTDNFTGVKSRAFEMMQNLMK
jgi:hypothetical protein